MINYINARFTLKILYRNARIQELFRKKKKGLNNDVSATNGWMLPVIFIAFVIIFMDTISEVY